MRRRRRVYLIMMGACVALFVLSWGVVRFFSPVTAVIMALVALFIPPLAAIIGNRSDGED